jgi:two-component system response regulator AdeR
MNAPLTTAYLPTILISDDEPLTVKAIAREARRAGLDPVAVTSPDLVHEAAARLQPRVILLDIHQPIDGRDLLNRLKHDPRTRHIPVLVLSGDEDQFLRHTCFELGARDYAVKPFDVTLMLKVLHLALEDAIPQPNA